ncbi:MAG: EthD family reductase [Pseudomonadota bacterium]|nr:EthD family reductase [Pseudomonadota bacterium]
MDRRTSLIAGLSLAVGAATASERTSAQTAGGIKITVLYGHPKSPEDFEKYYFGTHMPLVMAAKGGKRTETSKCPPAADGSAAAYYRIFEIWFDSQAEMTAITGTPEWKKVVADVPNFATGGVTRVMSKLD